MNKPETDDFRALLALLDQSPLTSAYLYLLAAAGTSDQLLGWHDLTQEEGGLLEPHHRLLPQHLPLLEAAWHSQWRVDDGRVRPLVIHHERPFDNERLQQTMALLLAQRDSPRRRRDDRPLFDYYRRSLTANRSPLELRRSECWVVLPPTAEPSSGDYVVTLQGRDREIEVPLRLLLRRDSRRLHVQMLFTENDIDADVAFALSQVSALMAAPYARDWLPSRDEVYRRSALDQVHFDFNLVVPAERITAPDDPTSWCTRARADLADWLANQLRGFDLPVVALRRAPPVATPAHQWPTP